MLPSIASKLTTVADIDGLWIGEANKTGPTTPNEQAAALAGVTEKKIGSYKTLSGTNLLSRAAIVDSSLPSKS